MNTSGNSLIDDLTLAAKYHYKAPAETEVSRADMALTIFRNWTGTNASTYADLLQVALPKALELRHFRAMGASRMGRFMIELINGQGHFGYRTEEDRFRRAVRVLMDELAMMPRDGWLSGDEVPKPDPNIQRAFLNLNRTKETT